MSSALPIVAANPRDISSVPAAAATALSYNFPILESDDIVVEKITPEGVTTILALGVGYTVAGAGNPAGGTITLLVAANGTDAYRRYGLAKAKRETDMTTVGRYDTAALEADLDRSRIIERETQRDIVEARARIAAVRAALDDAEERIDAIEDLSITAGNFLQATDQETLDGVSQVKGITPQRLKNRLRADGYINPKVLGAKGDFVTATQSGTDDKNALLAAIAEAKEAIATGEPERAAIILPPGNYRSTAPLLFNEFDMRFIARGGPTATRIIVDHDGVGGRMYRSRSQCKGISWTASTARAALSYDVRRIGFLHLGPSGAMQSYGCKYQDMIFEGHPGPGGLFVMSLAQLLHLEGRNNKGAGIVVDTGRILSAVLADFGLVSGDILFQGGNWIILPRTNGNGGQGLVVGHPDDTSTAHVFRTHIFHNDSSGNALDAAARYSVEDNFLRGSGIWADDCVGFGAAGAGGYALSGRSVKLRNHRVVGNGDYAAKVKQYNTGSQLTTSGVEVQIDAVVAPPASLNPAVVIEATNLQVDVSAKISSNITTLAAPGYYDNYLFGATQEHRHGASRFDAIGGVSIGPLNDDQVAILQFNTSFTGIALIWSEASAGRATLVYFAVGATPFSIVIPFVATTVTGATGPLTTGTGDGVDDDLNVNAHTDDALYVKNRTGGAPRTYHIQIFTSHPTAHITGITTP